MNSTYDEQQYLDLIKTIIHRGEYENTRNGTTLSIFGHSMRFSLRGGVLPLITTKKLAWKTCFHELMWFIRGSTDNAELQERGVHIWDANSSREFLDARGLTENAVGDLGPIYGYQWRTWNAPYKGASPSNTPSTTSSLPTKELVEDGELGGLASHSVGKADAISGGLGGLAPLLGIDQLANLIRDLKNPTPETSRRLIVTAWNPEQINQMALPPCHIMMQFHVSGGEHEKRRLSCAMYQRSCDVALGVPFNIASYSFLTHILAKHCDLEAHEFVYFMGNAHIYEEHLKPMMEQMLRRPHASPQIQIAQKHENIDTLEDIVFLRPYKCDASIPMSMVA
jgi:thymidylate synthase